MPLVRAPRFFSCRVCGQPHQFEPLPLGTFARCVRCHSRLSRRTSDSLNKTAAFALAALILYIPANLLPILRLEIYGSSSDSTVWQGVVMFWRDGEWFMAGIVVCASIVIPVLKLLGLFFLVITTGLRMKWGRRMRTIVYHFIDSIGRWAMLDLFLHAILVATEKLQRMGSVWPASGLLPFGCVVVFTLFAAASFDPQLIWEDESCA